MESLGNAGKHQRQGNGKCSGAQIVHNGLAAYGADLFNIAHGNHTGSDGEQHNGNDDKFQQVQENGTKGLNVGFAKLHTVWYSHQDQTGNNANT